jgi:hypothetical protein
VVTEVAAQHELPAGGQRAVELGEHHRQVLRRRVVGGEEGQDAAEFAVPDVQCRHRTNGEPQVRERQPGLFDHVR